MATFREIATQDHEQTEVRADPAVLRVFFAILALGLVVGIPYIVPGLEEYRPWIVGDNHPFYGMFSTTGAGPLVAEASGGVEAGEALGDKEAAVLAQFGDLDDEAPLEDLPLAEVGPVEDLPLAEVGPADFVPVPDAGASPGVVPPGPDAGAPAPPTPKPAFAAIKVPPEAYKDVEVKIEDPSGAMKHFYDSLHETAQRKPGAITRVAHWGDSAIAADGITSATRTHLQRLFGDSGHGFILAASSSSWYSHKGVRYGSKGWKTMNIIHRAAKDKRYGFGGVRAHGYPGVFSRFATADKGPVGRKVSRYDIYYLAGPKQGDMLLTVDKGEPVRVPTAADAPEDRVHSVEVPDGEHELRIQAKGGQLNLYGVAMERDRPGVVYDGLGIVGFIEDRHMNADFDHFKKQLALRDPNLMILMYGGNKLGFPKLGMTRYEQDFEKVIKRFRKARPTASCLVMSPLDHGERYRGGIRTVPRLHKMVEVQRKVALRNGCAWYSAFEAMGGEGSMGRWANSKPALGWRDYAHVTKHGAKVMGGLFYQALMAGYVEHTAK
jgi:hypothetical protein